MSDPAAAPPPEEPKMEVHHKPKPVHSWRELLTEIGVIVVGVGIALAAEQIVDAVHWHYRVEDAMAAVTLELRDDTGPQIFVRAAAAPCYDSQLDGIRGAIEAGRSRAEVTALIERFAPPRRTWSSNAWDSMLASGAAAHLPTEKMTRLGWIYTGIPAARALAAQDADDLVALRPTRHSGDRLSTSEADTMLAAVARLRTTNRRWDTAAAFVLAVLEENGVAPTPEQRNRFLAQLRDLYGDCVIAPAPLKGDPNEQIDDNMRRAMQQGRGAP